MPILPQFVDMYVPVKGMVNFAVSEEVVNSALRVWHKGTLAELSFVRNAKVSIHESHAITFNL